MDIFKSNIVVGLTAGVAATLLAPVLVPAVAMAARPLAKSLIKGGVLLYEKGREGLARAGEEMEDMIAEVHSELSAEHYAGAATGAGQPQASAAMPPAAGAQTEEETRAAEQQRARPEAARTGNGAQS